MKTKQPKKAIRGFSAMSPSKQRRICTMGGIAISRDRKYMAELGRKGGTAKHRNARNARKAKMAGKD